MTDRSPSIAGYARVSTVDQTLDRQLTGIFDYTEQNFDIDRTDVERYRDKSTGTDVERSGYQQIVGDVDAELHVVSEGLTLRPSDDDPYQDALFQLLGVFAELEAKIKERTSQRVSQHGKQMGSTITGQHRLVLKKKTASSSRP